MRLDLREPSLCERPGEKKKTCAHAEGGYPPLYPCMSRMSKPSLVQA